MTHLTTRETAVYHCRHEKDTREQQMYAAKYRYLAVKTPQTDAYSVSTVEPSKHD